MSSGVLAACFSPERLAARLPRPGSWRPYPAVRDRVAWDGVPAATRDHLLGQAARLLADPWPLLTATDYGRFSRDGNRQAYERPYFARRTRLAAAVLVAALAGPTRERIDDHRRRVATVRGDPVGTFRDGSGPSKGRRPFSELPGTARNQEVAMGETTFTIGADASCTDGSCGKVTRVVVDPVARAITHLVVEPKLWRGPGRLVPLDLVDAGTGEIRLRCTLAEFGELDLAEETQFLPGSPEYPGYDPGQMLFMPYYGRGMDGASVPLAVTIDAVPLNEVEVRRGEHVHATDGPIGRVQGLVIDPDSHHVTHVLLQEGHVWGRKEVAIPIGAVTEVNDDGIRLNITKQQVQDLPPVDLQHPNR